MLWVYHLGTPEVSASSINFLCDGSANQLDKIPAIEFSWCSTINQEIFFLDTYCLVQVKYSDTLMVFHCASVASFKNIDIDNGSLATIFDVCPNK